MALLYPYTHISTSGETLIAVIASIIEDTMIDCSVKYVGCDIKERDKKIKEEMKKILDFLVKEWKFDILIKELEDNYIDQYFG